MEVAPSRLSVSLSRSARARQPGMLADRIVRDTSGGQTSPPVVKDRHAAPSTP